MPRRISPWIVAVVVTTLAAAACTGPDDPSPSPSAAEPVSLRVAFVGDLSFDAASQVVSPSLAAVQLAVEQATERGDLPASIEVVPMDTRGDLDRTASFAGEIADDPTVVAAIVAPFWDEPVAFGERLDAAGVPTLSLSTEGVALATQGWSRWRRAVPPTSDLGGSLTAAVRASAGMRGAICIAGDGSAHAAALATVLRGSLGERLAADVTLADEEVADGAVGVIATAGCATVAWTGFDPLGSALLDALGAAGMTEVRLVGSDGMKDERFLAETERGADGTVVVCPCVDLTTSTRIEAQRFVHDFQSATGSSPGVYAAEAWDVAGMVVGAIRAGALDRDTLAAALDDDAPYEGLAGRYAFRSDGELEPGASRVVAYRAEGLRWLPVASDPGAVALPVRTRGYLAVGSCRRGKPFLYRDEGRLTGFEVELTDRIAARLGLLPIWSELPCPAALRALETGRLDALVAPAAELPIGTPASRVVLALDGALVVVSPAPPQGDPADALGPDDTVAVVDDPVVRSWAANALAESGARLIELSRERAYGRLERGAVDAVADLEYAAWAAVEHRPGLWVVGGHPTDAVDVIAGSSADAEVLAAIDRALGRLFASGRYALLFGASFPGAPIPEAVGGSVGG